MKKPLLLISAVLAPALAAAASEYPLASDAACPLAVTAFCAQDTTAKPAPPATPAKPAPKPDERGKRHPLPEHMFM